jgi:hypothetical protein
MGQTAGLLVLGLTLRRGNVQSSTQAISPSSKAFSTAQVLADPLRQVFEAPEIVPIPGDEIAMAALDVDERSKAIDLQLENEFLRVERLRTAGKPHGAQVPGEHLRIIREIRLGAFSAKGICSSATRRTGRFSTHVWDFSGWNMDRNTL